MPLGDILKRITNLEARRTPLERAHDLARRGVPVKDWPQLELEAFAAESPELKQLSDAELEQVASS